MPQPVVAELFIPDPTIDKLWSHGIVPEQVHAVLARERVIVRNRSGRAAPFVLLGFDEQGRCLAIPIAPTHDRWVWRVITAWYCKSGEEARLGKRRSVMESSVPYGPSQEPLDDEERELMDPGTWDWDSAVDADVAANPLVSFSIALSLEEHRLLARVARAARMTTPAYMKHVALVAARESEPDAESMAHPRAGVSQRSA
jgi:hypothetical protein